MEDEDFLSMEKIQESTRDLLQAYAIPMNIKKGPQGVVLKPRNKLSDQSIPKQQSQAEFKPPKDFDFAAEIGSTSSNSPKMDDKTADDYNLKVDVGNGNQQSLPPSPEKSPSKKSVSIRSPLINEVIVKSPHTVTEHGSVTTVKEAHIELRQNVALKNALKEQRELSRSKSRSHSRSKSRSPEVNKEVRTSSPLSAVVTEQPKPSRSSSPLSEPSSVRRRSRAQSDATRLRVEISPNSSNPEQDTLVKLNPLTDLPTSPIVKSRVLRKEHREFDEKLVKIDDFTAINQQESKKSDLERRKEKKQFNKKFEKRAELDEWHGKLDKLGKLYQEVNKSLGSSDELSVGGSVRAYPIKHSPPSLKSSRSVPHLANFIEHSPPAHYQQQPQYQMYPMGYMQQVPMMMPQVMPVQQQPSMYYPSPPMAQSMSYYPQQPVPMYSQPVYGNQQFVMQQAGMHPSQFGQIPMNNSASFYQNNNHSGSFYNNCSPMMMQSQSYYPQHGMPMNPSMSHSGSFARSVAHSSSGYFDRSAGQPPQTKNLVSLIDTLKQKGRHDLKTMVRGEYEEFTPESDSDDDKPLQAVAERVTGLVQIEPKLKVHEFQQVKKKEEKKHVYYDESKPIIESIEGKSIPPTFYKEKFDFEDDDDVPLSMFDDSKTIIELIEGKPIKHPFQQGEPGEGEEEEI